VNFNKYCLAKSAQILTIATQ